MVPPILKDDQEGQLIDGKLRSVEWRARAARSKTTDSNRKDAAVRAPAEHDLYTPPTRYAGSVLIPADQLLLDPDGQQTLEEKQPRDARNTTTSRDPYFENLIARVAEETDAPSAPDPEALDVDDHEAATDRFFEQQAVSPPRALARQTLGVGTAGLAIA